MTALRNVSGVGFWVDIKVQAPETQLSAKLSLLAEGVRAFPTAKQVPTRGHEVPVKLALCAPVGVTGLTGSHTVPLRSSIMGESVDDVGEWSPTPKQNNGNFWHDTAFRRPAGGVLPAGPVGAAPAGAAMSSRQAPKIAATRKMSRSMRPTTPPFASTAPMAGGPLANDTPNEEPGQR
jgi:hypothetical protein